MILTNLVEAVLICYIVDKDSTWAWREKCLQNHWARRFSQQDFLHLQPHHVSPCSRSDQARENVLGLRCPK